MTRTIWQRIVSLMIKMVAAALDWLELHRAVDNDRAPSQRQTAHQWFAAACGGAIVARSQILVSGSTATLLGTLTNETGGHVCFSGMPPYAITGQTDGSATILLGDFNSRPREQPSREDVVMRPGASIPYRSLPGTLQNPHPLWDGTDWCTYSHSTMLDDTFCYQREAPIIQVFDWH